jgi:hypothetical protein
MGEEGLLFTTEFTAEKVKFNIVDGKAIIDNKEFIFDRVQPITLKETRLGRKRYKPFYILKWDKIEPANIIVDQFVADDEYMRVSENGTGLIVKSLDIAFPEKGEGDILPEMLKETHDMRYMKHLKKYSAEGAGGGKKLGFQRWMLIPVAFLISGVAIFLLQGGRFF